MRELENAAVCVVGLGYVGLPLACLFSKRYRTTGYDSNTKRIAALSCGHDSTLEVDDATLGEALANGLVLVSDLSQLDREMSENFMVFVVAVPTPVDTNDRPNLTPLLSATRTVAQHMRKGDVVIYESTVYPGVTEDECIPLLERESGMVCNEDFMVGYSPERVNPGDREHRVENIRKVTSGSSDEAAELIDRFYNSVLKGGTFKAKSIKVAEAAKVVENCQRDVNIAFMNELSKIFNAMGIDTTDVLEAASTKWNFINMKPGLVGGHCIGVDPYYLINEALVYGVLPRVMQSARRLNDGMGDFVASQTMRLMNKKGVMVKDARILILGFAFKENCADVRNTKVADIYHVLKEYSSHITIYDPWVDAENVYSEYGIELTKRLNMDQRFDAAILAVAHNEFAAIDIRRLVPQPGVVYDVKSFLPRNVVDGRL